VSPVTIRRWTATGFLLCTRTAGGHRRIDEHDIDDLAKAIGNSNHLAAGGARAEEEAGRGPAADRDRRHTEPPRGLLDSQKHGRNVALS
jgi:hypothetical protein